MARTYRVNAMERAINAVFRLLTRLGLGAKYRHILTVRGRKTGKAYSTPVDVMEKDGRRFLVAPYGVVNWVRNARVAGVVTLTRGGRTERVRVSELSGEASAPVLRQYISEVPVTRPYFDVELESSDEESLPKPRGIRSSRFRRSPLRRHRRAQSVGFRRNSLLLRCIEYEFQGGPLWT